MKLFLAYTLYEERNIDSEEKKIWIAATFYILSRVPA